MGGYSHCPADQKLQCDAEGRDLQKKIQGAGENRYREQFYQKGIQLCQTGQDQHNRKPDLPEPVLRGSDVGDQIQVECHGDAVCKQRDIKRCFTVEYGRKSENKQAYADSDHKKGPKGLVKHKKIQKQAGNAGDCEDDREKDAEIPALYNLDLPFLCRVGGDSVLYFHRLIGIDNGGVAQRTFLERRVELHTAVDTI